MQSFWGSRIVRTTALVVMLTFTNLVGFAPKAEAALAPTPLAVVTQARAMDLASVQRVLENKKVTARLADLGYTKAEITQRLSALSDSELHRLATQMNSLDAGGDAIGFIIGILVIALLVVVIVKLADKTITVR